MQTGKYFSEIVFLKSRTVMEINNSSEILSTRANAYRIIYQIKFYVDTYEDLPHYKFPVFTKYVDLKFKKIYITLFNIVVEQGSERR